jgi:hypothetical protein
MLGAGMREAGSWKLEAGSFIPMLPARRHEITRVEDPYTVTLNAILLFVVLFYIYPLKFLFTAFFSFFLPILGVKLRIYPHQLGTIFAIYGAGFVVIFLMFGLLYLHAYRKRHELGLTPLEVFDTRATGGEHLVSVSIGALATVVALVAPPPYPVFSGFTYFLMGPAHWFYGMRVGKLRKALVTTGDAPATT